MVEGEVVDEVVECEVVECEVVWGGGCPPPHFLINIPPHL